MLFRQLQKHARGGQWCHGALGLYEQRAVRAHRERAAQLRLDVAVPMPTAMTSLASRAP